MGPQHVCDQRGKVLQHPTVIPAMFKRITHLKQDQYLLHLVCKLATAKAKSSNVVTSKLVAKKKGALSRDQYEPGGNIVTDQFVVSTAGRLLKDYGHEIAKNIFHDGILSQETTPNLVWIQPQVS